MAKDFVEQVTQAVLGEDFSTISPASVIGNASYRYLIEKAIEWQRDDPQTAGALVRWALEEAERRIHDPQSNVDEGMGGKVDYLLGDLFAEARDLAEYFRDIGERVDSNTTTLKKLIKESCNPPRDILSRLPRGDLPQAQVFFRHYNRSGEISSLDVGVAIDFAVKYIHRLEELIRDLADGNLSHDQILAEGGHGCYMRRAVGFENLDAIIATGPKRGLIDGSGLPMLYGAPMGDNMMTGTVGLLKAVRNRRP